MIAPARPPADALADHPPGWAHLDICISPEGEMRFHASGDRDLIVRRMAWLVDELVRHPHRLRCMTGTCRDHGHGAH